MEIKLKSTSAAPAAKKVVTFLQAVFGFNAKVATSVAVSLTELSKEKALDSLHIDDFLAFAKAAKQVDIDKAIKSKSIQNMKAVLTAIVKNKTFSGKLAAIKKFKFKSPTAKSAKEPSGDFVKTKDGFDFSKANLAKATAYFLSKLTDKAKATSFTEIVYQAEKVENDYPQFDKGDSLHFTVVDKFLRSNKFNATLESIEGLNKDTITLHLTYNGKSLEVKIEWYGQVAMITSDKSRREIKAATIGDIVGALKELDFTSPSEVKALGVKVGLSREDGVLFKLAQDKTIADLSSLTIDLNSYITDVPVRDRKALYAKILGEGGFTKYQKVLTILHADINKEGVLKIYYDFAEINLTYSKTKTKLVAALTRWLADNANSSRTVFDEYLMTMVESRSELKSAVAEAAKRLGISAKVEKIRDDASGLGWLATISFGSSADKAKYDAEYNEGLDEDEQVASKTPPARLSETVNKLAILEGIGLDIKNPKDPKKFKLIGPFNHDITNIFRETGASVYLLDEDGDITMMISGTPEAIEKALAYTVSGKPTVSAATKSKVNSLGVRYEKVSINLEREADYILRNKSVSIRSIKDSGEGSVEIDLTPLISNVPTGNRKALFDKIVGEDGFTEDQEVVTIEHASINNKGMMKVFYINANDEDMTGAQIKSKLTAALKRWLVAQTSGASKSTGPKLYMAYNHNNTELMRAPGTQAAAKREATKYSNETGNYAYVAEYNK